MIASVERIWIILDDNEDSYINYAELEQYLQLSFGLDLTEEEG